MGLAEQQAALARLFVDADARRHLRADPAGFAREFGLTERERDALLAIPDAGLTAYAGSLERKQSRRHANDRRHLATENSRPANGPSLWRRLAALLGRSASIASIVKAAVAATTPPATTPPATGSARTADAGHERNG
jgi:hypothetical protein